MAKGHRRLKGRRNSWRSRRDTIPARRRRRRTHRRDTPRGGDYSPVEVESGSARRGVNLRLFAAIGSLILAIICGVGIVVGSTSTIGVLAAFSIGFVAFNAGIALLLAARREESLHMLANDAPRGLLTGSSDAPGARDGTDGTDGTV